tara:strand:+ start:1001 stop:1642 length:642 start_codon:yes stop_codon:yes gene_type:complete
MRTYTNISVFVKAVKGSLTAKEENMTDILSMMESDFENNFALSVEKGNLGGIAILARKIRTKQQEVEELDKELKARKKDLLKLTDEELPSAMQELGISSFALDDGSTVDVKPTYGASILVANRLLAYGWLRDNGYDDIIKNVVSCEFGRGEDDKASAFKAFASKEGFPADQNESIHSGTLKAFVRERVEAGDEFPMELFGAYIGQRAIIKGAK